MKYCTLTWHDWKYIFGCCCHGFILLSHNAYFGTVAVLDTRLNTVNASKHDYIPCAVNVLLISKSKKPLTSFTKATVNTSLSVSVSNKTTLFSGWAAVFRHRRDWCYLKVLPSARPTCVFFSPAGRPRSIRACSLSRPARGGEACAARSSSPGRCEHAGGRCSCAPV